MTALDRDPAILINALALTAATRRLETFHIAGRNRGQRSFCTAAK
jgi:hypothetical protein